MVNRKYDALFAGVPQMLFYGKSQSHSQTFHRQGGLLWVKAIAVRGAGKFSGAPSAKSGPGSRKKR
jgi:hypothetical protein